MTKAAIKALFTPGRVVTVTNHYITRPDYPCHGTQQRTILRSTGSHLWFTSSGNVPWPKGEQLTAEDRTVRFYGGGAGQATTDLFLTITLEN